MRTKRRPYPPKKPMTLQVEVDPARLRDRGYLVSMSPEGYVFRDAMMKGKKAVATYVLSELVGPPDKIAQAIGNFYAAKRRQE